MIIKCSWLCVLGKSEQNQVPKEGEEEGEEKEEEDRRPAGRRVCAVTLSLRDWPGAAGKFPLPLVLSSAAAPVFFARKDSLLSNAVGPRVRRLGGLGCQIESSICGPRSEIGAPSLASIERDCERTLDDKFSPAGRKSASKSTPAKKSALSLKSMEHIHHHLVSLPDKKERSSSHQSPLVIRTSRRHTARCRWLASAWCLTSR